MVVIEKFLISKTGNLFDCEDMIFFSSDFVSIIDGATARNKKVYNGASSGRAAAEITYKALSKLSPKSTLREVIEMVNNEFNMFYKNNEIDINDYANILTASCIIYSKHFHQIWIIGDCRCLYNNKVYSNENGIDNFVSMARSFVNQAEILKGKSKSWIAKNDPGAKYISKLLTEQFLFQNHNKNVPGEFGYLAFDGRPIKEKSVKIIKLNKDAKEFVLASDGYPLLKSSLLESEKNLEKVLFEDPLCIYSNKGVKGVKEGFVYYDDRAYIKVSL